MLDFVLNKIVEQVRQRDQEGDRPVTPRCTQTNLEDAVLALAAKLDALAVDPTESAVLLARLEALRSHGIRQGKPRNPDGPEAAKFIRSLLAHPASGAEDVIADDLASFRAIDQELTAMGHSRGNSMRALTEARRRIEILAALTPQDGAVAEGSEK